MRSRIFGATLLLLSALSLSSTVKSENAATANSFSVGGQVTNPSTFDLAKLQKLPSTRERVTYFAAGKAVTHEFMGVLLWDVLQSVGVRLDQSIKNDILHKIVIVTGSDGYVAVFGAGEIDPGFGGHQIMIAYAEDGQSLEKDRVTQIIAPGDKMGGRFVSNIVKIDVRDAEKSAPQP